ncbi:MAG: polysaccharide biosynthesis tyrosine autokinase [Planctomycetota bacterium]|jgi:capsular exopolysaccharide synthesis family protein
MTTIPATVQERIPLPAAPSAPPAAGAGMSIGDLIGVLKQRAVMIILLWLVFSIIAVGLFFLFYVEFPVYRAEAWVECISNRPTEAETLVPQGLQKDEHDRFINSQARLMKSPQILMHVLTTVEVRGTKWFKETQPPERRALELDNSLSSAPIRDTNYIRVSMGCRTRTDPAKIVYQVVSRYLKQVRERAKDPYREELETYKNEREGLEVQVKEKLRQIQSFTGTLPPGALTAGGGITYERLSVYAEQVAAYELQTMELEGLSKIYNDPAGPGVSTEDRRLVEQDPLVATLANQVFLLEQELQLLHTKFGSGHREVKQFQSQLEVTQEQLTALRDRKLTETLEHRAEQVRTAFLNSQHALLLAREKLAEAEAIQSDLDRKAAELQTLHDELQILKDTRERVGEFIREIERITSAQGQALQVELIQHPVDPIERSSPHLLMLPAGVVFAFLLAAGIPILLEFTNTSIRSPQDIVRHLSIPMLGVVPDVDDEEVPIDQVETAVRDAPHSMIAEAFRTIRTNLQFSAPAERQRSIVVTSPRPEDGKTAVASNLAASLAQGGRRVLLVDANFRRPALHTIYPNSTDKGLSNLLIGEGTVESVVRHTDIANLDVLHTGPTPPNPAERLASAQVQEFLDAAAACYDQVIIDGPPVLLATDATVLASQVDGTILVCRAKENSRGIAQRACDLLLRVNAHVFGAVLNAAQTLRGGYFREQMAAFYDYQTEEALDRSHPALPPKRDSDTAEANTAPKSED